MTGSAAGPWHAWESLAPREKQRETNHADTLAPAIQIVEADPNDISALKDVCLFACRSSFKIVRERALEAIRVAGDRQP